MLLPGWLTIRSSQMYTPPRLLVAKQFPADSGDFTDVFENEAHHVWYSAHEGPDGSKPLMVCYFITREKYWL